MTSVQTSHETRRTVRVRRNSNDELTTTRRRRRRTRRAHSPRDGAVVGQRQRDVLVGVGGHGRVALRRPRVRLARVLVARHVPRARGHVDAQDRVHRTALHHLGGSRGGGGDGPAASQHRRRRRRREQHGGHPGTVAPAAASHAGGCGDGGVVTRRVTRRVIATA